MLLGSLPLTVLANEARAASTQSDAPMVKVSSQYHEKLQNSDEVRVLPDENGVFTVTISLTEKMTRGQSLEIYYEIEDGTAKVGNAFAEDGTVEGGDYLGAFADQSAVDHNLVEQAHVGTKGTIGIPYNISSFELKIYSNVLDTNEDKSFTFRLTGVKNKNNHTNYVLSETERELTCYLRTTPTVSVSSVYSENGRVIPNEYGKFFFDISLDWNPINGDEIFVYYRTIDDTAVAEWGDYVGVGYPEDTYVTLNQANNYTARVTVQSVITEEGFYEVPSRLTDPQLIVSRKFVFDLYQY